MTVIQEKSDYLRPAQAAKMCSVSPRTLRNWLREKRIACHKVSTRCVLLKRSDIHEFIGRTRTEAMEE